MDEIFARYPQFANVPVIRSDTYGVHGDPLLAPKFLSIARAAADLRIRGDWVEFGVFRGATARAMLDLLPYDSALHLFDSFEGLAEAWSGPFQKGSFSLAEGEIPRFDDLRVKLNRAWFHEVDSNYFKHVCARSALVHVDCDLYSAAVQALDLVSPALRRGSILLFDEYVHDLGDGPVTDEHDAFTEWVQRTGFDYRYLWRTSWTQVAIEIV